MKVPTYDNLQVGANTLPTPSFRPATTTNEQVRTLQPFKAQTTPDIAGRQLQQTGDTMQKLGSQIAAYQIEAEKNVAQVRVDDALNRAKEAALRLTHDKDQGYTNIRGNAALERQSGLSLEDEYTQNLVKEIRTIGEGLGTDAQKAMFSQRASELATNFRAGAMRHSADEYKTYQLSVAEGVQSTALNEIGLNYSDPVAVQGAVDRIKANVYRQAQLTGKSAEWQEAKARQMTSGAHKVALMAALEKNDLEYSQGYMAKFSNDMEADDILQVRGLISKEMTNRVGLTVAAEVSMKAEPFVTPTDSDRAFNILMGTESNNKQFGKDGKPLTSSAGAIGIAQVMPKTGPEAAKIAGVKWDEERYRNDPQYNASLGKAYFGQQLKDFGGRLDMAYAAYNAGPGRLKQGIARARKEGGDWLDHMPEETRNYVAKNMREYEAGMGKPKAPTFDDIDTALRSDPRLKNNPDAYKVARADAEKRFNDTIKAQKQRGDEAVNMGLEAVEKNGGSYSALPLSLRNAIPADKRDQVMSFADKVAKGSEIQTDPNVYYALTLAAAEDPKFAGEDLRRYFDKLAPGDRKHFMDLQAKSGKGEIGDIATATQQKSALVQSLGLKGETVGVFQMEADKALSSAQREKGKELTQEERQKVLDRLVLKGKESGFFGSKLYQFQANAQGREITPTFNDDQKRQAAQALQRRGVVNPTPQQIESTLRARYGVQATKQSGATGSF